MSAAIFLELIPYARLAMSVANMVLEAVDANGHGDDLDVDRLREEMEKLAEASAAAHHSVDRLDRAIARARENRDG